MAARNTSASLPRRCRVWRRDIFPRRSIWRSRAAHRARAFATRSMARGRLQRARSIPRRSRSARRRCCAPGWPSLWGDNRVDYGMDPEVVGPGAPYESRALGAMQAIPALSIVMKLEDLFDANAGIYSNAGQNLSLIHISEPTRL